MTKRPKDRRDADDSVPPAKTLVVRVFWQRRRETKERCAELLADCLSRLRSISPLFESWKTLGRSRSEARTEIEITADALARGLRQNHTDIPRKPIPSLGFHFGAWAGEFNGPSANLSLHCGSYDPTSSNSVILSITCEDSWRQVSCSTARRLLDVFIENWNPEGGTAGFGLFHELPPGPDIDWMVYLGARHEPPTLPEPTRVERIADGGTVITIAPEPPDLSKSHELKLVESVRQSLEATTSG